MIRFHPFARWCALSQDGTPLGYLTHIHGQTELHLKQGAPSWLNSVRAAGPWETLSAAQAAIRAADPERQPALRLVPTT